MKNPERRKRNEQRLNAATNVAAGGALLAGAAGASYANDRALERKGLQPPVKTMMARGKLRPAHARYGAAKLGVRGLQVTGIPLAAYGAYNLVKPDEKVKRVSAKDDIAKPIARGVTFQDAAEEQRKRVGMSKALFRTAYVKGIGRVRVVGSPKKDYFDVVDARDQRRLVPRNRITPLPEKRVQKALTARQVTRAKARAKAAGRRYPNAYDNMVSGGAPWRVKKADDRFLRNYRDRISPNAEAGYDSMRRQRNKDRAWAATQAGLTGVNAAGLAAALKARSKVWTPVTAAATAFSGSQAVRHARKARGYDKGPMEGIRRKAKEREREGVYAPGRGREPVDVTSRQFQKAAMPAPRSVPKGLLRRPTMRRGHVARRPRGRMVSVRGSFG